MSCILISARLARFSSDLVWVNEITYDRKKRVDFDLYFLVAFFMFDMLVFRICVISSCGFLILLALNSLFLQRKTFLSFTE